MGVEGRGGVGRPEVLQAARETEDEVGERARWELGVGGRRVTLEPNSTPLGTKAIYSVSHAQRYNLQDFLLDSSESNTNMTHSFAPNVVKKYSIVH